MKRRIIVVLILLTLSIWFYTCLNFQQGKARISNTINEAKERGVFIKELRMIEYHKYNPVADYIKFNEFWIEQGWVEGDSRDETIKRGGTQFMATLISEVTQSIVDSIRVDINNKKELSEIGVYDGAIYMISLQRAFGTNDTMNLLMYFPTKTNSKDTIATYKFY